MTSFRHETLGSKIDRSKVIKFEFDGRIVSGFEGDTIASALLANGVRLVGRSFKYHRPRGVWGMGSEEPNALVDVLIDGKSTPNLKATTIKAREGMVVRSVNVSPSAAKDRYRFMDLFNRFIPAGFYYKTFMALGWDRWEPMIRKMAGLGRIDANNQPPVDSPQINAECDVLVIGTGPAGLAAAKAAAEGGQKVWLIDEAQDLGGSLRWRGGTIDGKDWPEYAALSKEAVLKAGGKILLDTTLWGAFDQHMFAAWQRFTSSPDLHWRIRAKKTILAAGAIERPLWFANNDLPGVMSAEAAMHYLVCYGIVPGTDILIGTANDLTYPIAQAFGNAGVNVTLIDQRQSGPELQGVRHAYGVKLTSAEGHNGVTGATVDGEYVSTDAILVSGGYTPTVHLWCQSGGKLDWQPEIDGLVPRPGTSDMIVVGAANGTYALNAALKEGHAAGGGRGRAPKSVLKQNPAIEPVRPDPDLKGRQWIDMQNDVTLKDVSLAASEGFQSVEHLKRYTTLGMATDQGRTSNFAGLAAMSAITGKSIPETGTTTYRPPFQPVPLVTISGRRRGDLFNPLKRLVLEDAHRSEGARFREYGGWLRPSVYGVGDETTLAQEEAMIARSNVGIFDASPLGKLEVIGPKAGELLDFTGYVRMSTLKPGRARYGFMLAESGIVYDDGVVLRLDENRFIVSASSSHVDGVRWKLEDGRQDRLGGKGVYIHDMTSAWTTLTVTGPKASELIAGAGIELPALTHMSVSETKFEGRPLRIARISFTGDKSFELSVPSLHAENLRNRLSGALAQFGGKWIGLEAVMIMRAEKGYILIGKDTDGLTMPHDLGWAGPREKRTDEYIGKRSLFTPEGKSNTRKQLVGFETLDNNPLVTGSHLVPVDGDRRSLGYVTSSYFSNTLKRPIALGLLENGTGRIGQVIGCFNNGEIRMAKVIGPCALDPEGVRLNG
ncbi:MAG: 2Fe-2S iron-sulfur cluster-binding protein [Rhizobiaceae bacterium]|nr:2Fe-2S iron-sulfur cluster-binding protein [Rhizobiaceae bacterium]